MSNPLFRDLDEKEAREFRMWARETYDIGTDIKGIWHPVIQKECAKMNEEGAPKLITLDVEGPSLEEAQKFVGGDVELVQLQDGSHLLVNEGGLSLGLSRNPAASKLYADPCACISGNAFHLKGRARWSFRLE